jgi:O-6-methylguanine DNA methyltransferase
METLRSDWVEIYSDTLPRLARARHPTQHKWPVLLDHCFARIILDHVVGQGQVRWDSRLSRPAVKNMSVGQLEGAIDLAERIRDGEVDLTALDHQSLEIRGKLGKYNKNSPGRPVPNRQESSPVASAEMADGRTVPIKRKGVGWENQSHTVCPSKKTKSSSKQSTLSFASSYFDSEKYPSPPISEPSNLDTSRLRQMIDNHAGMTDYSKRLYATLLSVPKGRYTTYAALSDALSSSARAVGNAMRNNPFAPEVPCHRVLASDGSIGGYRGSWGAEGKSAHQKIELLKDEGVTFDSRGKARGLPYTEFRSV